VTIVKELKMLIPHTISEDTFEELMFILGVEEVLLRLLFWRLENQRRKKEINTAITIYKVFFVGFCFEELIGSE
jgi:hypothetical protein